MSNWELKKISDVADFLNYKRVPLSSLDREKRKGIFPYYGASGIVDYIDDYIFDGIYLLVSEDGENLRTRKTPIAFKATGKFWVNNHAHILAEKEEGILDYLEYYFSNFDLAPFLTGAVQPKLNKANLDKIEIPVPKKRERLVINKHLNSLSGKITINQQINQTLEAMAQALFKSWFVDFEPTRSKLAVLEAGGTEEDANLAAMIALSGKFAEDLAALKTTNAEAYAQLHTTASLFPSRLVESELGEIPEGWEVKSLDAIANYLNGLALQKFRPKDEHHYLPVLKIAQLKKGFADGEEKASPDIKAEYIVDNGDVVFSWSGSLVVDIWCGGRAALNQHLFKVTSRHYPKWFYYHHTLHHLAEFQRIAAGKAVTMGHIKREHLTKALCAVPSIDDGIMRLGDEVIGENLAKQIGLRLESLTLTQLRDSLLPKLLSGEISVDTEIQTTEAV